MDETGVAAPCLAASIGQNDAGTTATQWHKSGTLCFGGPESAIRMGSHDMLPRPRNEKAWSCFPRNRERANTLTNQVASNDVQPKPNKRKVPNLLLLKRDIIVTPHSRHASSIENPNPLSGPLGRAMYLAFVGSQTSANSKWEGSYGEARMTNGAQSFIEICSAFSDARSAAGSVTFILGFLIMAVALVVEIHKGSRFRDRASPLKAIIFFTAFLNLIATPLITSGVYRGSCIEAEVGVLNVDMR